LKQLLVALASRTDRFDGGDIISTLFVLETVGHNAGNRSTEKHSMKDRDSTAACVSSLLLLLLRKHMSSSRDIYWTCRESVLGCERVE